MNIENTKITNVSKENNGYWINYGDTSFFCDESKFKTIPKIGDNLEIHSRYWCFIVKCIHNGHIIIDKSESIY